jgi:hypothetical protein
MDKWNHATIEMVTWKEIREDFIKANHELGFIIDELSPNPSYTFYDTHYPFGSESLKNGFLYIPNGNGGLSLLNSSDIDQKIKEDLSYNLDSNPASLILSRSFEIFMVLENHTIPLYGLIPEGKLISTWRVLKATNSHTPAFLWNMTAGARSIFMLPKISEALGHRRLSNLFNSNSVSPTKLHDQWHIFREFANHPEFGEKWSARTLFFSKKWFENLNDPKWMKFKDYLLQSAWDSSDFWRNQFVWDIAFSIIQKNANLRPNPRHMDTVKHLLTTAVGAVPGFSPALDDNAAPISRLQELYQSVYKLEYAPIMMTPSRFSMYGINSRPTYYSLEYPGAIEFSPSSRTSANKIVILNDIMRLLKKCLEEFGKNYLHFDRTPLYEVIDKVRFDAFHMGGDFHYGIRNSTEMPKEDSSFLEENERCKDKPFPAKCPFVNGCIRISSA